MEKVKEVYGESVAAEVRGEMDRGQGLTGVAVLARVLARHQYVPDQVSSEFNSEPLPMDFDPDKRDLP